MLPQTAAGSPIRRHALSPKNLAQLLLLAIVLVWGVTFVLVKSALANCSPLLFNLLRMAFASLALAIVNRKHLRLLNPAMYKAGALAGLFLAIGYQFQTLGLARTTPARSAFVTGLVVVFVPALTLVPGLRPNSAKRPGMATALGAVLAFVGLLLLTTPAGTATRDLLSAIGTGDLLTLVCAAAFAAHLITLSKVARDLPAGLLATVQITACTLAMLLTLPLERPHASFTPRLLLTLAICSLFATAAAFTIQSYAQKTLPPTQTVILLALEPAFAWLTGVLVLHDTLSSRSFTGAILILSAIVAIELLPNLHSTEIPA